MDQQLLLDLINQSIWMTIKLSAPIMVIGLFVGVIVALFQALTQIQEMTLVFVPKILAIFAAMFIFMPWMVQSLVDFTQSLADLMIAIP